MHAGFAAVSGLVFVIFRLFIGKRFDTAAAEPEAAFPEP
jgi:hypothetical protein